MVTYFTFQELVKTNTGLENYPTDINLLANLVDLAKFLDQIRKELGLPIIVNSGYRSPQVNAKVGGVKTSHHTMCLAADIKCKDNAKLLEILKKHIKEIDQLIVYPTFIHISIAPLRRGQIILKAE